MGPRPGAERSNPADNITALARQMCDLIGEVRSSQPGADPWRLALAAFQVGPAPVIAASGVPAGPATDYVNAVDQYTAWYERQPGFGGPVPTTTVTTPAPTTLAPRPTPTGSKKAAVAPTSRAAASPSTSRASAAAGRDAYARTEAESYTSQAGTGLEDCTDAGGGRDVGYLAPGDWLHYAWIDFGSTAARTVVVRYAGDLPPDMTAVVEVRLDRLDAPPVGTVLLAGTGGWQSWVTLRGAITPTTGIHEVYLTVRSSNGWEVGNLNWLQFAH